MLKLKRTILLLISLFAFYDGYAKEQKIKISGEISKQIHASEITFIYWEELISETLISFTPEHRVIVPIKNGRFNVEMQIDQPLVYLSFSWNYDASGSPNYSRDYLYIAEAGDNVVVKIDSNESGYILDFQGHGATKYNVMSSISLKSSQLSSSWYKKNKLKYNSNDFRAFKIERPKDAAKYLVQKQFAALEQYKEQVNKRVYDLMQINLFANQYMWLSSGLVKTLFYKQKNVSYDKVREAINQEVLDIQKTTEEYEKHIDRSLLSSSPQYIDFKRIMAMINAKLHDISIEQVLKAPEQPEIRDKCLTAYIMFYYSKRESSHMDSIIHFADTVVQDSFCRQLITNFISGNSVGQSVNDFSLPDVNDKIVNLSDFKGKVVFVDFWYVGCGACASYYSEVLREVEQRYRESGDVVFITISIDKDKTRWIEGIESGKYTSREAINLHCPDGMDTPVIQQFAVKSFPRPLLIDRDGKMFNNSEIELRANGVSGLVNMIEKVRVR